jgi:hypothetical protein
MLIRKRKSIAVIRVPIKHQSKEVGDYFAKSSLKKDYHVVVLFEDIERVTIEILCK